MSEQIQTVTSDTAPVEPVDQAPAPVVSSEPSAEPVGEGAPTEPQPKAAEPGKDETPPWLKAEITKERNRRRAAEEETRMLKEQVDRLTKAVGERSEKPQQEASEKPRREDFFDPDEYEAAKDAWVIEQAKAAIKEETTRTSRQQAEARQIEDTQKAWSAQVESAKKAHPDFEDVVYSDDFQCTPAMMNAIVADKQGAEVAYHLGQNPDEAARIASLHPVQQIIEIGRLSASLEAKPVAVSRAPAPITPLGNEAPAVKKSADEESEAEYFARRAAEAKANGERMF